MKNNQPVTENEIPFPNDEEIISTTDLKGIITSFNHTFLKISGFNSDELIHKNHNIIRHPDMPPAAFSDLWQHLKNGKNWMGIVKNRCKNGDYYWVDAFVSPMYDQNNKVIGYESVRVKPSAEHIARAKKIYKQLNDGQSPSLGNFFDRLILRSRAFLLNIIAITSGFAAYWFTPSAMTVVPFIVGAVISTSIFYLGSSWVFSPLQKALKTAHKEINNPLMALIYTGRSDEIGQIQLPAELLKAKLRTILGRLKDAAIQIEVGAEDTSEALKKIHIAIKQQAEETDLVATAIMQMSSTIQDVANNTSHAAQKAMDTDGHSQEGVRHASGAVEGLHGLNQAVDNISTVVSQLDLDAKNIGSVVDVIKGIAEQTNLLALNAAIEAARAGEHGRGFAVVADEVRTLSGKTQESTQEIQSLIENLNNAVTQAVAVMDSSQQSANDSETEVSKAIESLNLIAHQVSDMKDLNTQIASTIEEQSATSESISKNIAQINQSAESVLLGVDVADSVAHTLLKQSHSLTDMVQRFKGA